MALQITDIKIVRLRVIEELGTIEPAWDKGGQMVMTRGGGSIVEVHTNEGITGIGPGIHPVILPVLREKLIGLDPFNVEQIAKLMQYYARGAGLYQGPAGVDIALWDIIGKASGQPLYKLFGGGADKVPGYASMVRLSTIEERVELAQKLADEGWQAMKLRLHFETMDEDLALCERVINAVGDRMTILTDANQAQSSGTWQPGLQWDFRRAIETARELSAMGVYWLEEPLPRYAYDQLARVNSAVDIPIAGGENNPLVSDFVEMLEKNVYDLLQPEGMVLGGITPLRRVGTLAELHNKQVCPHHGGRGLGTIAHLHLVASWPHCPYLEMLNDPPFGEYQNGFSILTDPPVVDNEGLVAVPQGPGLGVAIDPGLVEEIL
jgi:L-alanine-DL-glutamate epimerase-like enolase superfamily enzyme